MLQRGPEGLIGGLRLSEPFDEVLSDGIADGELDKSAGEEPVLTAFEEADVMRRRMTTTMTPAIVVDVECTVDVVEARIGA